MMISEQHVWVDFHMISLKSFIIGRIRLQNYPKMTKFYAFVMCSQTLVSSEAKQGNISMNVQARTETCRKKRRTLSKTSLHAGVSLDATLVRLVLLTSWVDWSCFLISLSLRFTQET